MRCAGHRVYPTTGRSRAEMPAWFDELGFDGMIGANGSYIESDGEVVVHQRLARADVTDDVEADGLARAFARLDLLG